MEREGRERVRKVENKGINEQEKKRGDERVREKGRRKGQGRKGESKKSRE